MKCWILSLIWWPTLCVTQDILWGSVRRIQYIMSFDLLTLLFAYLSKHGLQVTCQYTAWATIQAVFLIGKHLQSKYRLPLRIFFLIEKIFARLFDGRGWMKSLIYSVSDLSIIYGRHKGSLPLKSGSHVLK